MMLYTVGWTVGWLVTAIVAGGWSDCPPVRLPACPPVRPAKADTVDRIVAIVGSTVILASEIDEEVFARVRNRDSLPAEGTPERQEMNRQVLQELVDLELLYQRARADTMVKVTEEDVATAVDEQIRNARQRYPSDQAYRDDLRESGFQTAEEYRRWLTERQRKQLMTNTLVEQLKGAGKLKPVIPTDREMRAFFEAEKGAQKRPETVSFRQVVVAPRPSPEAKARALAQADSILRELRQGADFATAARRFSMDSASADQGGTLGWIRRGVGMHPAFEVMAFALRPGFVSDPVETPFGYHLIQVERVQPAEVLVRHILIMPEITQADADSARATAERIRGLLQAGALADSLQRTYHDPLEEREVRNLPADRLPPAYAAPLQGLQAPGTSSVFGLQVPRADARRTKWAVVQLDERVAAGEIRFEDVKDNIRTQLGERMALRRLIDSLRAATYVEVRGP